MIIGYDISILEGAQLTGVEKLALNLFRACWEIAPEDQHILICRQLPKCLGVLPSQCQIVVTGPSRLWRWMELRRQVNIHRCQALISGVTHTTLPCGVPLYSYIHELQWRHKTGESSFWKYRLSLWLSALTARQFLTNSEATKADIYQELPWCPAVSVIYPSYDQNIALAEVVSREMLLLSFGLPDGEYFLFVSSIRPKKNIHLLVECFSRPEMAGKRLLLAGKILHPEIVAAAAGLSNVHFLGYTSDSQAASLYTHAQAFLYVSLNEGFGLPILEAYMKSCPVVASRSGSIPEVAGNAAHYVSGHDSGELAALLQNFQAPENFTNKAKQIVSQFSWQQSARKLLDLVHSKS